MSKSILYMSMSLDGFIAGPNDTEAQGLGTDGMVLHDWLNLSGSGTDLSFAPEGESRRIFDEMMSTGAVLTGRRTFDHGGHWDGDHHDGVQIYVPTRDEPPEHEWENVHYVTDGVESAMRQAKESAGGRDVMVHGAELTQSLLRAGVLDELEIHLVPVLLGEGRRLFDGLGPQHIDLEVVRVLEAPGVTHIRYRVVS
ncbi:dihydrofolate reductase [Thermoleophilia bacterium SCSIO 60948]|nr:dihydrofolate reductase [Thermoleophilia bacterium SCSIO 60948]